MSYPAPINDIAIFKLNVCATFFIHIFVLISFSICFGLYIYDDRPIIKIKGGPLIVQSKIDDKWTLIGIGGCGNGAAFTRV